MKKEEASEGIPEELEQALEDLSLEAATLADLIRYIALNSENLEEDILPPPPADCMH